MVVTTSPHSATVLSSRKRGPAIWWQLPHESVKSPRTVGVGNLGSTSDRNWLAGNCSLASTRGVREKLWVVTLRPASVTGTSTSCQPSSRARRR